MDMPKTDQDFYHMLADMDAVIAVKISCCHPPSQQERLNILLNCLREDIQDKLTRANALRNLCLMSESETKH